MMKLQKSILDKHQNDGMDKEELDDLAIYLGGLIEDAIGREKKGEGISGAEGRE